jgi:hypothetical protein
MTRQDKWIIHISDALHSVDLCFMFRTARAGRSRELLHWAVLHWTILPLLSLGSLAPFWIISIPDRAIFERTIETGSVIRRKRQALSQPLGEIWVADEIPPVQQAVVCVHQTPRIFVVESTSREERCIAKDFAEAGQIDRPQAPGFEELFLLLRAEHLLIPLSSLCQLGLFTHGTGNAKRKGNRLTGSTKLTYDSPG